MAADELHFSKMRGFIVSTAWWDGDQGGWDNQNVLAKAHEDFAAGKVEICTMRRALDGSLHCLSIPRKTPDAPRRSWPDKNRWIELARRQRKRESAR